MAGNIFSDAGLVARGFDEAAVERNRIAGLERDNAFNAQADPIRLRTAQLGLDQANMTMEELQRQRAAEAARRAAIQNYDPATGEAGLHTVIGDVSRQTGDAAGYANAVKAIKALEAEGVGILARGALTGEDPARVAARANQLGASRIKPESLRYEKDAAGNTWIRAVSTANEPFNLNASQYAKMAGIIKPRETVVAPEGSTVFDKDTGAVIGRNPKPTDRFAPNTGIEKVTYKDSDGNERQYLWNIVEKKWEGDAPPAGAQQVGSSIRRDLPLLQEAEKTLAKIPGMATRTNPENPLDTSVNWTPQGLAVLSRAERLMLGNRGLPATAIIEIATAGKPKRADNGDIVVEHNGRYYPLGGQGGEPIPAPAPRPAPAPAAAAPALPAGVPPEDAEAFRYVQEGARRNPPDIRSAYGKSGSAAPKPTAGGKLTIGAREYDLAAEAKDAELSRLGRLSRLGIRDPNADTQTWIAYIERLKSVKGK